MIKIGILTFHRSINYGAFMQCYSLYHRLQKEFPDCKINVIDYYSKKTQRKYISRFLKPSLQKFKHPLRYYKSVTLYVKFKLSMKYLPMSKKLISASDEDVYKYIKENYDIVIVGSDAVWNWTFRGFPNPYLLSFDEGTLKFSYAASAHGMGMENVLPEQLEMFGRSLLDYRYIGVRDEYTMTLVKKALPKARICYNCDPTFFLNKNDVLSDLNTSFEDFSEKIMRRIGLEKDRQIIGIMGDFGEIVAKLKEKYGNKYYFVSLYRDTQNCDKYLYNLSPLEWSIVFGLFSLTVTSFYHGTLLSLYNETPVISIDTNDFSKNNLGKIEDVLKRMDLSDCFYLYSYQKEVNFCDVLRTVDCILSASSQIVKKIKKGKDNLINSSDSFISEIRSYLNETIHY